MDQRWAKYSSKDTPQERLKEVSGKYKNAFEDLTEILEESVIKDAAVRDYGPGWEHKQIARNEYNAAIKDVLKLINLKE
jgi:hypothetical protein